jgi:hypothetical protein
MMATLCSWESLFGPYHPQTLCLTVQLGIALWTEGDHARARLLLERAVDKLNSESPVRNQALTILLQIHGQAAGRRVC